MAKDKDEKLNGIPEGEPINESSDTEKKIEKLLKDAEAKAEEIVANALKKVSEIEKDNGLGDTEGNIPYEKRPEVKAEIERMEKGIVYEAFKDNDKYKDDIFVSVGNENVNIQRGKKVILKRKFAEVVNFGRKADLKTAEMIDGLEKTRTQYN